MVLRLAAIIAILWLGVVFVRQLGHQRGERAAFPRRILTVVLLGLIIGVPGSLLVRFALRSGSPALILVAVLFTLTLVVALGWYVSRAIFGGRHHHLPPRN